METKKYIPYFRVSAKSQGIDGLGIEAQISSTNGFLKSQGIDGFTESYIEVESGKNPDRKELKKAIIRCKETKSILIIAKLDRLSRNVVFIFTLREELRKAGVDFLALDIPDSNTLTLGVMASHSQHERERISDRTKSALNCIKDTIKKQGYAVGKRSGRTFTKLGNDVLELYREKAQASSAASRRKKKIEDVGFKQTYELARLLSESGVSNLDIAIRLNLSGYKTPKGFEFLPATVSRLLIQGKKLL